MNSVVLWVVIWCGFSRMILWCCSYGVLSSVSGIWVVLLVLGGVFSISCDCVVRCCWICGSSGEIGKSGVVMCKG